MDARAVGLVRERGTDAAEGSWVAARWTGTQKLALAVGLAVFFAGLTYVNESYVCYPQDNDLDEVGWIAAHLTLHRPESFANQGYPPGLPLVLRLISPLVGSLLRATFLWQAVAATASVFFVARITAELCRYKWSALLGTLFAMFACLLVATTEFADGTCTAIFLAGLWALSRRGADRRGLFWFGLACGGAYLFRTHYLALIVLVPVALLFSGMGWRTTLRALVPFCAGFAATAWPLWLLNLLAYGSPLHAGVSQYNISMSVIHGAFSWTDYPHTYNRWPLSRILRERPKALVDHVIDVALNTFGSKLSLAAVGLGAFAIALVPERRQRQLIGICVWLVILYVLAIIVPTRFTERSYAPVAMLTSILAGCGLAGLCQRAARPRWALAAAAATALFLAYPSNLWADLKGRHGARRWNQRVVRALEASGMRSSDEVFTSMWNFYPLQDPRFITFYNYGGWIELDSEYARERPHPTATTVQEWQAFFAAHPHLHFAVLQPGPETKAVFAHPPADWKRIYSDNKVTAWTLPAAAQAAPQDAAVAPEDGAASVTP